MDVTNEIVRQILEFLERFGGAVAQEGFRITIAKVYADATVGIASFAVALVIFLILIKGTIKFFGWSSKNNVDEDFDIPIAILLIAGNIGMFVLTIASWPGESIKMLMAPEWYAIQSIIELIK